MKNQFAFTSRAMILLIAAFILASALPTMAARKLGAVVGDGFVTFSIYSENATRIELCLFERPTNPRPVKTVLMKRGADNIWSAKVEDAEEGAYYAYRAWGPNWPYVDGFEPGTETGFISDVDKEGNRFNPNKLLVDPYAKTISHDPIGDGNRYRSGAKGREVDTAAFAPKSIVVSNDFDWQGDKPLNYDMSDCVIYETHVRGLTMNKPLKISAAEAGSYKGLIKLIPYFKTLGITSVELLPVHETVNDQNSDTDRSDDNYWGYMTLNYFSPDRRYSSDKSATGPVDEFKTMVREFHKNGIEIIMDVVFNHTGEGGIWGTSSGPDKTKANILSFRGIDNSVYYELTRDKQFYYDNTGCGGNMRVTHPYVQRFILDSLEYWVKEMHVDGFRFDLASVLGNSVDNHGYNFDYNHPLLKAITTRLPKTKMIAEPWAIGGNSYQVGGFPSDWKEWNGKFRDVVRKAVLMESNTMGDLAKRLCGSSELYSHNGRPASFGVNFVTAHDGLTLYDVAAYNKKNNHQAWPYGPSDGGEDHNNCRDWGSEELRLQQVRNMGAILLLSRGTPMLLGGDEFARTKRGNNNTYNLDSVSNWFDWNLMKKNKAMVGFWSKMIRFRRSHPALCSERYPLGKDSADSDDRLPDLQWHGAKFLNPDWSSSAHAIAYRLDGSKEETGGRKNAADLFVMINLWRDGITFQLPPNHPGKKWHRLADTAAWAVNNGEMKDNFADTANMQAISDGSWENPDDRSFKGNESYSYGTHAHSIVILMEK
ncbi:MAG: glycogen debranching enzyme [Candidatus Wallbacteria bacterium HGW-Wallbacteria-1]|jgi:glycogen operon protein|uniref:Glycogen debranching enzyme n=1 Tax=Candidatus Wallbacteria bacterium HGW-Wallbacteria-1 TaxID=2013854 RepID=A0A2N1PNH7_9BACT|nr:MAG: glycogen debranching enzyme [Candidatus Wallbacteria bacterium HGW-Wallbacteria-1]